MGEKEEDGGCYMGWWWWFVEGRGWNNYPNCSQRGKNNVEQNWPDFSGQIVVQFIMFGVSNNLKRDRNLFLAF